MDSNDTKQANGEVLEYVLYGAIILLTAFGAIFYKSFSENVQLASMSRYLGIGYFGFLGWAFYQLNCIHRRRKGEQAEEFTDQELNFMEEQHDGDNAAALDPERMQSLRPMLGLTVIQLAIVMLVFLAAFITFTWALTVVRAGS